MKRVASAILLAVFVATLAGCASDGKQYIISTKNGRMYAKLKDGDRVVMVHVLRPEDKSLFLISQDGHVLHFAIDEINLIAGVGKGVIGIKLDDDDVCLGGAIITRPSDAFQVETSGGRTLDFTGRQDLHSRGGKGFEAVKRASLTRIVPPAIELVNWDEIEGKVPKSNGKTLFE